MEVRFLNHKGSLTFQYCLSLMARSMMENPIREIKLSVFEQGVLSPVGPDLGRSDFPQGCPLSQLRVGHRNVNDAKAKCFRWEDPGIWCHLMR